MATLNKITLIGYLGRDPEIRYTPDGQAVTNFSMATTEKWTDKASGEKKELTTWFRIVAWRRLAEIAGEYLARGRQVYVEGRLQVDEWKDKEGNNRFTLEVVANQIVLLGRKDDYADTSASSSGYEKPAAAPSDMQPSDIPDIQEPSQNKGASAPEEDDIPF